MVANYWPILILIVIYHGGMFWYSNNKMNTSLLRFFNRDTERYQQCTFLVNYPFLHDTELYHSCKNQNIIMYIPPWIPLMLVPMLSSIALLTISNKKEFAVVNCIPCVVYSLGQVLGTLSPADNIRHVCMLMILALSSTIGRDPKFLLNRFQLRDVVVISSCALLCLLKVEYFALFPFLLYLIITQDSQSSKEGHNEGFSWQKSQGFQLLMISVLVVVLYSVHQETIIPYLPPWLFEISALKALVIFVKDQCSLYVRAFDVSRSSYEVSYGILWYLHALTLSEFTTYFHHLLMLLPVITSAAIVGLIRNSRAKDHIVMNLMLLTTQLFLLQPSLSDIFLLLLTIVIQNTDIIEKMRYLPIIVLGISVPLCLYPVMFDLWVNKGSGNANFLFFQGLAFWVFLALFIIEFINTSLRLEDEKSKAEITSDPKLEAVKEKNE